MKETTAKRRLIVILAVVAALGLIIGALIYNGERPQEIKMQENTAVYPAAEEPYRLATFAMG